MAESSKSGGLESNAQMVMDINPMSDDSSNPRDLVNVGGMIFFTADDMTYDAEPWRSSGSEVSTERVADINPTGSSDPRSFIGWQATVCFVASDDIHGTELWVVGKPMMSPAINLLLLKEE